MELGQQGSFEMGQGSISVRDELGVQFIRTLVMDVLASLERERLQPSQQNRRELVRTIFAAIEGSVWEYRLHITGIARELGVLTNEQEFALSEVTFQVSDTGKIGKQARFIPLTSMFRLVTRIAKSLEPNFEVRFDTGGWERFRLATAIRNRVTHPKRQADLFIEAQDIAICLGALYWLFDVTEAAMTAANAVFATHVQELKDIMQALKDGDPAVIAEYHAAQAALDR